ncbi:mitogen-activated protein kinase kinase kinase [Sporothrix brasiliensis 5110]|uniref:MAP kinase kinase kinase n=1 Tax=Sporothrix brasiliensis 5110 TaxID=1398154 RepID=A0A0C2IRQ3_9PEZI|nr:mitogen-activated protein kinase kinase kinase [Sporothrix brasiliensis 5110]KIH87657.1 mitogen-activated protein kinase kinase kinase [Sporothrix brasiliensis 5110]
MASEASPRVRFAYTDDDRGRLEKTKGYRHQQQPFPSDSSLSPDSPLSATTSPTSSSSFGIAGGLSRSHRGSGAMGVTAGIASVMNGNASNISTGASNGSGIGLGNGNGTSGGVSDGYIANSSSGGSAWPQRPSGPNRTLSNAYQPQRRPGVQPAFSGINGSETRVPNAKPRQLTSGSTFRAQEREYVKRLREQDYAAGYFDNINSTDGGNADSDSEGETPSSEGPFDDRYDQEAIMFYNFDDLHPTEEDIRDASNRERLEWHGMLEAVLTGDVVRQEKKRLIGAGEEQSGKTVQKSELWVGIRAKTCGRQITVQRRMIEESRSKVDRMIDDIINFRVEGFSEAGKTAMEQVVDVINKIEKAESLYPTRAAFLAAHKAAATALYEDSCDTIVAWSNTSDTINRELAILRKWVGNDELDFTRSREKSPSGNGLTDESSFLDRLLKEEGLRSLHVHFEEDGKSRRRSMLEGISETILKAKDTLTMRSAEFRTRHLPSHVEDLLTLVSFPARLIEEIVKVRLAYAKKMKESAQQNSLMQDQMISQFQVLLNLAIKVKLEYVAISQPEPGWELPNWIDESFDQAILDALKYYFKMLNWKLTSNRNTFKEAELLFQEWEFANEIGSHLYHGDVEVAEQFSSLTFKAFNRLSQTFDKELQRRPKESISDMSKRYKQVLDSVRVRQRMLQRFSRRLSDNYENACDFSIAMTEEDMELFFDRLVDSGHFQVYTHSLEREGVILVASPSLQNRHEEIQSLMGRTSYEQVVEDPTDPYVLVIRPEGNPTWYGQRVALTVREEPLDLKTGHLRLIAGGSQGRLVLARKAFLENADVHLDLVVEQRSNLKKVNAKMTEIRRMAYKLSNTFMDSVEKIQQQTRGDNCQDLIQMCFVFATEFGQRSMLYMDSNRRQMHNIKLTKLALDWVNFICEDCVTSDRRTFRWAVLALEFAMGMTRGRHILGLTEAEYEQLRDRVSGCMSLLISHFDIMGARSSVAAQAERQRLEASANSKRPDKNRFLSDAEASAYVEEHRMEELNQIDEVRKSILEQRSSLGRVLEASNEVDRSLAYLSSTATNFTMRWQQGYFVGGGTFGNVYAAMNLDNGQLMAVKEIRLQDPKLIPTIATQIKDEMRVLESLDHPNVVSYYGIEVHRDRVYIFMEFCSGGSLASLLEHGRIEDEQVVQVYALQLLEGLAYLHEIKIAHRDIKPENILLDHNGIIKYVDFGAAKVIARHGRTMNNLDPTMAMGAMSKPANRSMTGTPMYMSPEVIKGETPDHFGAIDVWSLGCVILEMATGRRPWGNLDNEWAIMYNIAQGNPPQLPTTDQLSPEGIDFLKCCFRRDSGKRSTAVDLLQHEWIMGIRNRVVEPSTPSDISNVSTSTAVSLSSLPTANGGNTAQEAALTAAAATAAAATAAAAALVAGETTPPTPPPPPPPGC